MVDLQILDGSQSAHRPEPRLCGEVDLWRVDLDQPDAAVTAASSLLCEEERLRASRGSPPVRRRRILARASLRTVLGSYTGVTPETLRFAYGAHGKPVLAGVEGARAVHFNLSRSGDCCLIAVTRVGPIGVDVERATALRDVDPIATRFFAPSEAAAICRLSGEPKLRSFYNCWTRSEAYVKARGLGLSAGLHRFVVSVDEAEPPAILALDGDDPRAWTLVALRPDPDLVAALALRTGSPNASVSVREWTLPGLATTLQRRRA